MRSRLAWDELEQLQRVIGENKGLPASKLTFLQYLETISPKMSWRWKHLAYIQRHLKHLENNTYNRLMIFCPPRHGKTEMTTLHFPSYLLEKNPATRIMVAAYGQILTNKFSRRIRHLTESRIYLSKERAAVEEWETEQQGGVRAAGVGCGITGQGWDWVIIDDPVKSIAEANSKACREKVWHWYISDLYTRLEPNAKIILIMTRWHHDDLAGRILQSEDKDAWKVISLPAIAEEKDMLGREVGKALCPERYNEKDLGRIKSVVGRSFDALYQQRPSAETGSIFFKTHFQYYQPEELPKAEFVVQSWDTAFKTGEENDYSVGTTWYYAENKFYLIDRWKKKAAFSEVQTVIKMEAAKHHPDIILIEDKASGQSLIEEFKRESNLPILPFNPERDKTARAYAITPIIDNGQLFLPIHSDWLEDFLETVVAFPFGEHDDDVDSMTMAIRYLIQRFSFGAENESEIVKNVVQQLNFGSTYNDYY
jgi:predicted phage terminase large subunit-like protein